MSEYAWSVVIPMGALVLSVCGLVAWVWWLGASRKEHIDTTPTTRRGTSK